MKEIRRFSAWLDELEATAQRFRLDRTVEEIAQLRGMAAAPHGVLILGEALRAGTDAPPPGPWAASLVSGLASHLPEGVAPIVLPTNDPPPAAQTASNAPASAIFVETFAYGSLRRNTLKALAVLAAWRGPLLVLFLPVPALPPAAREAILEEARVKVAAAGLAAQGPKVWDPAEPVANAEIASCFAIELRALRRRKLFYWLIKAHRQLLLSLSEAAERRTTALGSIEREAQELRFKQERVERRLDRALRVMRSHLDGELPRLARSILDLLRDQVGLLAEAAFQGGESFAQELQRSLASAAALELYRMLPQMVARSVAIFSESGAKQAAGFDNSELVTLVVNDLLAELSALALADELLPMIRGYDLVVEVLGPLGNRFPKLKVLEVALRVASKIHVASAIADGLEELREPLRQKLGILAGVLADRTHQVLLDTFQESIALLGAEIQSEEGKLNAARSAAIPKEEFDIALRRLAILGIQLQSSRELD